MSIGIGLLENVSRRATPEEEFAFTVSWKFGSQIRELMELLFLTSSDAERFVRLHRFIGLNLRESRQCKDVSSTGEKVLSLFNQAIENAIRGDVSQMRVDFENEDRRGKIAEVVAASKFQEEAILRRSKGVVGLVHHIFISSLNFFRIGRISDEMPLEEIETDDFIFLQTNQMRLAQEIGWLKKWEKNPSLLLKDRGTQERIESIRAALLNPSQSWN